MEVSAAARCPLRFLFTSAPCTLQNNQADSLCRTRAHTLAHRLDGNCHLPTLCAYPMGRRPPIQFPKRARDDGPCRRADRTCVRWAVGGWRLMMSESGWGDWRWRWDKRRGLGLFLLWFRRHRHRPRRRWLSYYLIPRAPKRSPHLRRPTCWPTHPLTSVFGFRSPVSGSFSDRERVALHGWRLTIHGSTLFFFFFVFIHFI